MFFFIKQKKTKKPKKTNQKTQKKQTKIKEGVVGGTTFPYLSSVSSAFRNPNT